MKAGESSESKPENSVETTERLMQFVQRRVATIGLEKVAEEVGVDAEALADFIFGGRDGTRPELGVIVDLLQEQGYTLVPLDGAARVDGCTLRELVYGVLASLEATKEDLREKFGSDLIDGLVKSGIDASDGESLIARAIESQREIQEVQGKLDLATEQISDYRPAVGKSRTSMIRVIGGLVQANYELNIHSARLDGISKILIDLETVGVTIDEGTLREYLREAAEKINRKGKT